MKRRDFFLAGFGFIVTGCSAMKVVAPDEGESITVLQYLQDKYGTDGVLTQQRHINGPGSQMATFVTHINNEPGYFEFMIKLEGGQEVWFNKPVDEFVMPQNSNVIEKRV